MRVKISNFKTTCSDPKINYTTELFVNYLLNQLCDHNANNLNNKNSKALKVIKSWDSNTSD